MAEAANMYILFSITFVLALALEMVSSGDGGECDVQIVEIGRRFSTVGEGHILVDRRRYNPNGLARNEGKTVIREESETQEEDTSVKVPPKSIEEESETKEVFIQVPLLESQPLSDEDLVLEKEEEDVATVRELTADSLDLDSEDILEEPRSRRRDQHHPPPRRVVIRKRPRNYPTSRATTAPSLYTRTPIPQATAWPPPPRIPTTPRTPYLTSRVPPPHPIVTTRLLPLVETAEFYPLNVRSRRYPILTSNITIPQTELDPLFSMGYFIPSSGHQFRYENRQPDGSVYGCFGYRLPGQALATETFYMAGKGVGYRVVDLQVARVYQRVNAAKFPMNCIE